ncbi:MAG: type II toxin-antitoxin system prevent-host-death family antitoxin [Pseudomonadota bacterium]|nr:type II toxin-antitoxin system prevent-host-death family antitoxin [Pseudomonadota bacterium]
MKQVGAYEAKTHLARLLKDVEAGESYMITHRGKPVAQLLPVAPSTGRSPAEVIAEIRRFSPKVQGNLDIKRLRLEGRR